MNIVVLLVVGLTIFEVAAAYVPQKVIAVEEEEVGKCVYNGEFIEEGQHFLTGCVEVNCFNDGTLMVGSCLPLRAESYCEPGQFLNPDLPYPKCCVRTYTCRTTNGIHVIEA